MTSMDFFPCREPIMVLIGPTAIGKTSLSISLAREFDFEIISVDSMQVYRYMDIGTAKISKEEMNGVRHHLISIVDPDTSYDAVYFEKNAIEAMTEIKSRGKRILLTGGTGLYLKALLEGFSRELPAFPEIRADLTSRIKAGQRTLMHEELSTCDRISATRIHSNDTHRLVRALEIYKGTGKPWSWYIARDRKRKKEPRFTRVQMVGLTTDRHRLHARIQKRSEIMLESGFEDEVRNLLERGYGAELKSMRSIGYSHMVKYVLGVWTWDTMVENLIRDTRRYAKRQYTWFKKLNNLQWVDTSEQGGVRADVDRFLSSNSATMS